MNYPHQPGSVFFDGAEASAAHNLADMTTRERADAILSCKRRCNIPHPQDKGKRIVGFIVDEDVAGLGMGILALDDIVERATRKSE